MASPTGIPDAAEFGQLRSWLAINGFSQAWITSVIGTGADGRTRAEITADLTAGFKDLPPA